MSGGGACNAVPLPIAIEARPLEGMDGRQQHIGCLGGNKVGPGREAGVAASSETLMALPNATAFVAKDFYGWPAGTTAWPVVRRSKQVVTGVESGEATVRQIDKPLARSIVIGEWRHETPPTGLSLCREHLASRANEASPIECKTRLFCPLNLVSWLSHHTGNKPNAGTQLFEFFERSRDGWHKPLGRYQGLSPLKGGGS
jgi:hypothetical protein